MERFDFMEWVNDSLELATKIAMVSYILDDEDNDEKENDENYFSRKGNPK